MLFILLSDFINLLVTFILPNFSKQTHIHTNSFVLAKLCHVIDVDIAMRKLHFKWLLLRGYQIDNIFKGSSFNHPISHQHSNLVKVFCRIQLNKIANTWIIFFWNILIYCELKHTKGNYIDLSKNCANKKGFRFKWLDSQHQVFVIVKFLQIHCLHEIFEFQILLFSFFPSTCIHFGNEFATVWIGDLGACVSNINCDGYFRITITKCFFHQSFHIWNVDGSTFNLIHSKETMISNQVVLIIFYKCILIIPIQHLHQRKL